MIVMNLKTASPIEIHPCTQPCVKGDSTNEGLSKLKNTFQLFSLM